MKIVALGGSLRKESYTYKTLDLALKKIREKGHETELIDLRELKLPFCDGTLDYPNFPDVEKLRYSIKNANGIILATPEYHGSLSGVLKNVLDLLTFEHVEGKMFALIAILGGELSTNAVNTLRTICRHVHAWVIPEQLIIPKAHEAFNEAGELVNKSLDEKMDLLIESLLKSSHRLTL